MKISDSKSLSAGKELTDSFTELMMKLFCWYFKTKSYQRKCLFRYMQFFFRILETLSFLLTVVDEQNAHSEEQVNQSPVEYSKELDESKEEEKEEDTKELESPSSE